MKIHIDNAKQDGSELIIDEDDIGYRVVRIDDEFEFHLRSKDPHGFISIQNAKGGLPGPELKGEFTGMHDAILAIQGYVNRKKAEANKPPQDKNTRKVQEILASR